MISAYKDGVKDALFPKKSGILGRNSKLISIRKCGKWNAEKVKKLRLHLQLSQQLFADVLGVKLPTIISWENGANIPAGSSARLMDIIASNIDILVETSVVSFETDDLRK